MEYYEKCYTKISKVLNKINLSLNSICHEAFKIHIPSNSCGDNGKN